MSIWIVLNRQTLASKVRPLGLWYAGMLGVLYQQEYHLAEPTKAVNGIITTYVK